MAQAEVPPEPTGGRAPATPAQPARGEDGNGERAKLSPAVRKLAAEHGLDTAALRGSGMGGRVTRDDVLAAVGSAPPAAATPLAPAARQAAPAAPKAPLDGTREELVKLSVMRKSIAEHMVRSLATSPHAWTLQEIDVTNLVRYREAEKESFKARHGAALTYLPFVVQIVCEVIKQYPWLNSTWTDEGVITLGQKQWRWARGRITAAFVLDLRTNPTVGKALMFFHGSTHPETDPRGGFDNYASIGIAWSDDLKHWDWPR